MPSHSPIRRSAVLAVLLGTLLSASAVHSATNMALGGIGGIDNGTLVGGDGTGLAQFTIEKVDLALVKQARDLDGNLLPDDAEVSPGQELYFLLYIDNPTDYPAQGLRIEDLLNEAEFTYIPDSLETASVPTGADAAAIWAGAWSGLSDALGAPDDIASATDGGGAPELERLTVGEVAGQANLPYDVPARSLRAVRFRVRVD